MLKSNLIVFIPKSLILNPKNIYDKEEIERRKKNTYYSKIIGILNENEKI
jgi:hypothetical protein